MHLYIKFFNLKWAAAHHNLSEQLPVYCMDGESCLCLHRCHCCSVNNIVHRTAAGQVVAWLVKTLENSKAVSFPDALRNFVADVARLKIRENQDIGMTGNRAALSLAFSDLGDESGIELHFTVKKKIRSKLVGYLDCLLNF